MLYTFAVAAVLVTLAELGDKTQLLTLGMACRYRVGQVLAGVFVGSLAVHLLSTALGRLVGDVVPDMWIALVAGVLFVAFGVWTLRGSTNDEEEVAGPAGRFGPVLTVATAFFVAELGDKTQIMSAAIAADPSAVLRTLGAAGPAISDALASVGLTARGITGAQTFWGVWLGSTLGMMIADGLAVVLGSALGKRLPAKTIRTVSGVIFILFGLVTLASAFVK